MVRQQGCVSRAGIEWISAAAPDPLEAQAAWVCRPSETVLIRVGDVLDAVVMRADTGAAVLDRLRGRGVDVGAVIGRLHRNRWAWLIGPGSRRVWSGLVPNVASSEACWWRYVGRPGVLTVPGPEQVDRASNFLTWVVPPGSGVTNLTAVHPLASAFLSLARDREVTA